MITTAFLFAAGRGERLLPLTKTTPKPMLCIHGKPLLQYHIENLLAQGIRHILINHAYLGGQIRQYFGDGTKFGLKITYLAEPPGALESAGSLAFFKNMFNTHELLLCINADIFTEYSFDLHCSLADAHNGHLILVPQTQYFKHADFSLAKNGLLSLEHKNLIFSGIAYYRSAALTRLNLGRYSLVHWLHQETQAQRLTGEVYRGLWQDLGTPERWSWTSSLKDN